MNKIVNDVSRFFHFQERSTTFRKEIIGGLSTFLAMAYILAVNPAILNDSWGALGNNAGHDYAGVFFLGTAISSMFATLFMGIYAKIPVALAPGMGVNAFFAYTVANSVLKLQLEQALVATFFSGLLYVVIASTPLRGYLTRILPKNIKLAIGAMIGLFLAYIGLSDSGIIVSGATSFPTSNGIVNTVTTNTKIGNLGDPLVIIAIITMILVFILHFLKVRGAAIIAMLAAVIMVAIAYGAKVTDAGNAFRLQTYNSFEKFGELSGKMWNSVGSTLADGKAYIAIFVFLYIDFFDTTGTLFSVGEQTNLSKGEQGEKWLKKANIVDATGTMVGSIMLNSSITTYVESTVGISQGARTGFSSVVAGSMFALAIAIWPVMSPVMPILHTHTSVQFAPSTIMPVTGPILVLVGALMLSQLKLFNWKQTIDIPVLFVTLIMGMLAYSVSTGIASGVIVYYCLNLVAYLKFQITKRPVEIDDETISFSTDIEHVSNTLPDLKKRVINPVMITMVLLAVTYFATMPLYAY